MSENSYLYEEQPEIGNVYRERQKAQFDDLLVQLRQAAEAKRNSFFTPDTSSVAAYEKDIVRWREQFKSMLGWPLGLDDGSVPAAELTEVAEDSLGRIYRVEVDAGFGLTTYGVLFLPKTEGPHPLVISQHGGQGTPELCSGFYGETNYSDMTRRVLKRGIAVFAPQLYLWNTELYGPEFDRANYDKQLKQVGSSIAAVEIHKIRKAIDYLISRPDIDGDRVGMIGLSYGGFYTMYTTAVDTRIKAAYSSCYINDRFLIDWPDFTWFNSGNTFLDAEVCAMIAPRFFWLEVGERDEVFPYESAQQEINKVADLYERLKISHLFRGVSFDGVHELDTNDEGIELFCDFVRNGALTTA
ncbi:alpha/beta hydrolase family protein [Cohnella soli]|uniref:Alpha/beta hydrolase family protein n=1 Tax=Cohnella soli TaxID=425005 RepID=A0ABW0I0N3_9BACL